MSFKDDGTVNLTVHSTAPEGVEQIGVMLVTSHFLPLPRQVPEPFEIEYFLSSQIAPFYCDGAETSY